MTLSIKRREWKEYLPGSPGWYITAEAACGMEATLREDVVPVYWKDGVQCSHAQCDTCDAVDHTVAEHADSNDARNWFPVLACNSWLCPDINQGCDGTNHKLVPMDQEDDGPWMSCYWWYQGNYPNGWVYWQGDWRCGPCAEKTIFGTRT